MRWSRILKRPWRWLTVATNPLFVALSLCVASRTRTRFFVIFLAASIVFGTSVSVDCTQYLVFWKICQNRDFSCPDHILVKIIWDFQAKSGQSWRNWDGWTVCWEIINTDKCRMQTFGSLQSVTSFIHSFLFPTCGELLYYSSRDVLFCFVLEMSRVAAS